MSIALMKPTTLMLLAMLILSGAVTLYCASVDAAVEDAIQRGDDFLEVGRFEDAVAEYTESINIDPDNVDAYIKRGQARLKQADYDNAVADMDKARKLIDPQLIHIYSAGMHEVYFQSGIAYYDTGLYDDAIILFDKAIDVVLSPLDYPATYYQRGMSHYRKGNDRRAIADFDRIIHLEQEYPDAAHYRQLAHDRLSK